MDKALPMAFWHIMHHRGQRAWGGSEGIDIRRGSSLARRRRVVTEVAAHVGLDVEPTTASGEWTFVRLYVAMDVTMNSQATWTIKCLAADAADMPLILLTSVLSALVRWG